MMGTRLPDASGRPSGRRRKLRRGAQLAAALVLATSATAVAATPIADSGYSGSGRQKQIHLSVFHNRRQMTVQLNCGQGRTMWIWYTRKAIAIRKDGSFSAHNVPTYDVYGAKHVTPKLAYISGRFTSSKRAAGKVRAIQSHGGCSAKQNWSFVAKYSSHE